MQRNRMYEFSHQPDGPFMSFKVYDNPQKALEIARATFDGTVYIALMEQLLYRDIMPSPEIMWAELMERLGHEHGPGVASLMEENKESIQLAYSNSLELHDNAIHEQVYVPIDVIACPVEKHAIKENEFKPGRYRRAGTLGQDVLKLNELLA